MRVYSCLNCWEKSRRAKSQRGSLAFELRIRSSNTHGHPLIIVRAYDDKWSLGDTHGRLDIEVRHHDRIIFPRGQLYVGIPRGHESDSMYSKEAVLSCVAMRPSERGGEGEEYYAEYSPEQLKWAEKHGDILDCERQFRYCDKDGNPRTERA